ncbi:MAG: 3'-5' exonuclease [Pirellulales bacterium]
MSAPPKYLIFDIESVADGALIAKVRYPGEGLDPAGAIRKYRDELMAQFNSDFIPYTFQIPHCVAVAKIGADYALQDLVLLDDPQFRPHVIVENFWRGWEAYRRPTLVTFNGRGFDVPLLELAAYRYGISVPTWFGGTKYDQPRNRYNAGAHLDLQEVLTNFGAVRFTGGLNLAASVLGKPGKMDVQGDMVQDLVDAGRGAEVRDYCRCDVLDTYFVFLRTRVLVGDLTRDAEAELVADAVAWATAQGEKHPCYLEYLKKSTPWENPW